MAEAAAEAAAVAAPALRLYILTVPASAGFLVAVGLVVYKVGLTRLLLVLTMVATVVASAVLLVDWFGHLAGF